MDVFIRNTFTGMDDQVTVEVDGTCADLVSVAYSKLGFHEPSIMHVIAPEHLQLCVEGEPLDEDDLLCDSSVTDGCIIDVSVSAHHVAADLRAGRVCLGQLPFALRKEPVCVLAAVETRRRELEQAHPSFKRNKEVVTAACKVDGLAVLQAHKSLRADRDVALAAVSQCGTALRHLHPSLQADKEVVLAAVTQSGEALEHAHPCRRSDVDVAKAAVKASRARGLEYVDLTLRSDATFMLWAVHQCRASALHYAPRSLTKNAEFMKRAMAWDKDCKRFAN